VKITIPSPAGHFSTLHLLAHAVKAKLALARFTQLPLPTLPLRGQGAPKNLQCVLPGSDFQWFHDNESLSKK
jgi:hypothetical protein